MAKENIHPNYQLATITCACGAVYETASTRGSFSVEICARCHPFYTGRQKLIDSAGRIERFQRRYQLRPGATAIKAEAKAEKPQKPKAEDKAEKPQKPKAEAKPKADKAEEKPAKPAKPKGDDKPAAS
jgi:large subunit ribosomal protein L31